jgi:hypothetical protein
MTEYYNTVINRMKNYLDPEDLGSGAPDIVYLSSWFHTRHVV